MKFEGTYTYLMDTPSGKRETKVVVRKGRPAPMRANWSLPRRLRASGKRLRAWRHYLL